MSAFFINVDSGRVATHSMLIETGEASDREPPGLPWHPLQGPYKDASTAVYAILRKRVEGRERSACIGLLCIRYGDRQASLEEKGWQEVTVEEIRAGA